MKKILLSLIALAIATMSFSQSTLVATLSHDGSISTFYGTTALKDALEKAENGDAITLGAGQFQAANITKAITLRGAGMSISNDSTNTHEATVVQGGFDINLTDSVTERLVVEGIYFASNKIYYKGTMSNALFMKTRIGKIMPDKGVMVSSSFIHCRIAEGIDLSENSSACLINCIVWNPYNYERSPSNFEFDNCVVSFIYGPSFAGNVHSSYYKNCVIMLKTTMAGSLDEDCREYCIPSSNVAVNCVGCTDYGSDSSDYNNIFHYMQSKNATNKNIAKPSIIFKTEGISYNDYGTFELTDVAKTKYLGADGKEVGIYGGNLPYEEDPTTPQITKCNVAAKSTADGKLSVDIEVKSAEY